MQIQLLKRIKFNNFPKKTNILFYEFIPNKFIKIFIKFRKHSFIFNDRKREINIFVFLSIFFSYKSIKIIFIENLHTAYVANFIKFSKAKIVINYHDNDYNFYRLKKYFEEVYFLSYQNGARHIINDLFGNKNLTNCVDNKNFSADYIFTFNSVINQMYKKYIECRTISIGNIKNNIISLNYHSVKNKIIFISQFRKEALDREYYESHGKKACLTKKWLEAERNLLPKLTNYCEKKNIDLYILGTESSPNYIEKEKAYYRKITQGKKWKYWNSHRDDFKKRYLFLEKFDVAISIWSTLAYELFARNKKVGFFRQNIPGFKDRNFGWPAHFPKKGFWHTSHISQSEVDRILNNLVCIKRNEWISKIGTIKNKIMQYDSNNNKLRNKIDYLLAKHD